MDTRHPTIASGRASALVLVDCQEKLWKVIHGREDLEGRVETLLRGAGLLEVPVVMSEQYPEGLGPTVPRFREAAPEARVITKKDFSCWGEPFFVEALHQLDRGTAVLAGVESHVCVIQTALDMIAAGYHVHVVADATGSRLPHNHEIGLRRAEQAGAVITSVESVLFDWMERCDHQSFKQVVKLLR